MCCHTHVVGSSDLRYAVSDDILLRLAVNLETSSILCVLKTYKET